jgi:hypothetical protein
MRLAHVTAALVASLLFGACNHDALAPASSASVAQTLDGHWTSVLPGSTGDFVTWLSFTSPDHLGYLYEQRRYNDEKPQVLDEDTTTFAVSPSGAVSFELRTKAGTEQRRHSITILDVEVAEPPRPDLTTRRQWTMSGYLAQDPAQRDYRREYCVTVDQGYFTHRCLDVTLSFAASPAALPNGGQTTMTMVIAAEAGDGEAPIQSGRESFQLPVTVGVSGREGLRRVTLDGFDPKQARGSWDNHLLGQGFYQKYQYPLLGMFVDGFLPVIELDPRAPNVLFHEYGYGRYDGFFETLESPPTP